MREHLKNPQCQSLSQSGLASHHLFCNPWTLFDTHLQSLDSLRLIFRCVSISRTHNVNHSHCPSRLASHHFLCYPWTMFDTHLQSLDSLWLIVRCVSISRTHGVSHSITHSLSHSLTFSLPTPPLQSLDYVWQPFATPSIPLTNFDIVCTPCQCQTVKNVKNRNNNNHLRIWKWGDCHYL